MTTNGVLPTSNGSLTASHRVRIGDLEHEHGDRSDCYIEASVCLVWPYSSSTCRFSLLLSETDGRLFKSRRQVKVTFHDGAARAAQESRIGIGDTVKLSLEGCAWQRGQDEISTPGKRLDYDLEFSKQLVFELNPGTPRAKIVHYVATGTPSPRPTPVANNVTEVIEDLVVGPVKIPIGFASPATRKAPRMSSGSFVEASLDPFSEDREYVYGRSAKRTKFARDSGAWTLLDDEEEVAAGEAPEVSSPLLQAQEAMPVPDKQKSPDKEPSPDIQPESIELLSTAAEAFERPPDIAQLGTVEAPPEITTVMGPPQTPARALRKEDRHIDIPGPDTYDGLGRATTPRLNPLASPGLPLVSPLTQRFGVVTGYFPSISTSTSELEASGTPQPDEGNPCEQSDEDLMLVEPPAPVQDPTDRDSTDRDSPEVAGRPAEQGQRRNLAEDDDMYGAPEPDEGAQPVLEITEKKEYSALDALEEFLHMSPIIPEPVQPFGKEHSSIPIDNSGEESEHLSSRRASLASLIHSLDGTRDEEEEPPEYSEMLQNIAPSATSSPIEQRPLKELEPSTSEPDSPSSEEEAEYSAEDQARASVENGPVKIEIEVKEGVVTEAEERSDVESPSPLSRPFLEEIHPPLPHLLPTPANTQEDQLIIGIHKNSQAEETTLLPTPNPTQQDIEVQQQPMSPLEEVARQESVGQEGRSIDREEEVTEQEEIILPVAKEMSSAKSRRVSQRLSRKSNVSDTMASPYFTPRKSQGLLAPSSTQKDNLLSSSPPAEELATSPTRPAQKLSPIQDQVEDGPSSQFEESTVLQNTANKTSNIRISKSEKGQPGGLTTPIAYYTPLASLYEHFGQLVDIIAICAEDNTTPARAKSGPKDYDTTLRIADKSSDPEAKSEKAVQIFRPRLEALPSTNRGDAIILRNFKVQTQEHKTMLLSTESSAWAVFDASLDDRDMIDNVAVTGPPLEYGRGETAYVKKIVQWWKHEGHELYPDHPKKAAKRISSSLRGSDDDEMQLDALPGVSPLVEAEEAITSVEQQPRSSRRSRRQQNQTDNFNNEDDGGAMAIDDNEEDEPPAQRQSKHQAPASISGRRRPSRRAKTPTANGPGTQEKVSPTQRRTRATKSPSLVHELRDGTEYVDQASLAHSSPNQYKAPPQRRHTGATQSPSLVHQLRDGTEYVDDGPAATHPFAPPSTSPRQRRTRATKSPSAVHELRDGTQYIDDAADANVTSPKMRTSPRQLRSRGVTSPSTVHKLRDGTKYVDDGKKRNVETDAVHQLRDGRRYADDQ